MPFKTNEYARAYYQKNKERFRERARLSYERNREQIIERSRKFSRENPDRQRIYRKRLRHKVMKEIFDLLGNQCELCEEKEKFVLQVDHIHGGGNKHYRKSSASVSAYYKSLLESIKNKEGKYRLLCANCNLLEAVRKGFRSSIWKDESFFTELTK